MIKDCLGCGQKFKTTRRLCCSIACRYKVRAQARRSEPEPPPVAGARWIALTQGKFTLVDDDDFEMLSKFTWCARQAEKGGDFYAGRRWFNAKRKRFMILRLHRWLVGAQDHQLVDHRNRNTLDNRRSNLRIANDTENSRNQRGSKNNRSGFKGVTYHKKNDRWWARIMINRKTISLGCYGTPEEAALVYDLAARTYFGAFAVLNCPDES